ncbi:MAG: class II glutamine amidotransferase [Myxococcaceae bacterium]
MTQDAALNRCELDRVRSSLALDGSAAAGLGVFQEDQIIQRTYGVGVPQAGAWEAPDSEIVLLATRELAVGEEFESATQPFRFRHWLFAAVGKLERGAQVRERLWNELPEFLQAAVKGPTWEEAAFVRFLAELRALGRMEDRSIDGASVSASLAATARALEQVSAGVGVTTRPHFALLATNGRLVSATRRGHALAYQLLEGAPQCGRHQLTPDSKDDVLLRDHRRRRSVVLATHPHGEGWVSLPDGATISVDRKLAVTIR